METIQAETDFPENLVLGETSEETDKAKAFPELWIDNVVPVEKDEDEVDEDKRRRRRRIIKRIIILTVILALAAAAVYYYLEIRPEPSEQVSEQYTYYTVQRRDITTSLSGSGTLQPADSYSVTTLVSGEILTADFEEGDIIEKDTLLYQIDNSDTQTSIEQAENSLAQSRKSYSQRVKSLDDLKIMTNGTGTIISINVEEGDKVSTGQPIATIRNSSVMTLTVPFGTDDADRLSVGQTAEVVLDGTFERLPGIVSKISTLEELLAGNMIVRMVTIDVNNPGGISVSHIATASSGDIDSNGYGLFNYKEEKTVTASSNGDVVAVYAIEGDFVQKDSLLVQLKSDSLSNEIENSANSLKNEELALENRYKQLDNFSITSPISGTIIEKAYKEGDKLETGRVLCIIYDMSYLTMTLNVDELDIASVEVGLDVTVTAEALGDKAFQGVVTRININGTTANGVTSYPVTIRIDETEGLLPGMNVQAEIIVSSSENVLAIPVSALSRGNRVLVRTDGSSTQDGSENWPQFGGEGMPQFDAENMPQFDRENMPQFDGEGRPQFDRENMPQIDGEGNLRQPGDENTRQSTREPQQGQSQAGTSATGRGGLPEGYRYIVVTTGASDGNYIEIISGLNEGDEIAYIIDTIVSDSFMPGVGMMPGGGFPGGGGGMPGGGGGFPGGGGGMPGGGGSFQGGRPG